MTMTDRLAVVLRSLADAEEGPVRLAVVYEDGGTQFGQESSLAAAIIDLLLVDDIHLVGSDVVAHLDRAIAIIDTADNRAMAADGPVGHVRDEMSDKEWRDLYVALTSARDALGERRE